MDRKKQIYYARTYRRLQIMWVKSVLFSCILILPSLTALIMRMDDLTGMITQAGAEILSNIIPPEDVRIAVTKYSILNQISYIELPTVYPPASMMLWNLAACFVVLFFMRIRRKTGNPIAIFGIFGIAIHMVSCIYFLLAADHFPYTAGQYSEIYVKQQVGIWLTFIILAGLVLAFMGEGGYLFKIATFLAILFYSLVFGAVRYILFLFILYHFSVLYMAILFFVFGPMFDFSYFVAIYSFFVNKNIRDYEFGKKKGVWKWS